MIPSTKPNKPSAPKLLATVPLLAALCAAASPLSGTTGITGNWRTPTGSVIQVYPCGTAACLRLVAIEKTAPGTVDANNPDPALRSRSLCGVQIGSGFEPQEGNQSAEGGRIYDPHNGKTYSGSLALNGTDHLRLRGYIGSKLFGRTEEWTRTTEPVPPCQ